MHLRIYLSSTKTVEGFENWKSELMERLSNHSFFGGGMVLTFIDPLAFNAPNNSAVVEGDTDNISLADAMFICMTKPTIGTIMELAYSTIKKPYQMRYLISSNVRIMAHPWINNLSLKQPYGQLGRITCCASVEQAVRLFVDDLKKKIERT